METDFAMNTLIEYNRKVEKRAQLDSVLCTAPTNPDFLTVLCCVCSGKEEYYYHVELFLRARESATNNILLLLFKLNSQSQNTLALYQLHAILLCAASMITSSITLSLCDSRAWIQISQPATVFLCLFTWIKLLIMAIHLIHSVNIVVVATIYAHITNYVHRVLYRRWGISFSCQPTLQTSHQPPESRQRTMTSAMLFI